METVEEHLQEHGVKPTAVRILIWQKASIQTNTFTLNDMEEWLPQMDRSSIFRALRLFTEHHLLHEINDGSGFQKYCVCRCAGNQHLNHIHFTCTKCGQTYCLSDYQIPVVKLPEGFNMDEVEYIVKGICPQCAAKE